jgi:hypothetical protein
MIPLALSRKDDGCCAPGLGHPAHDGIALRRDPRGRERPRPWQLTLDHQNGALLGAVIQDFLGDDSGREIAERLGDHPFQRLLAPGYHAVAGHEVGTSLDGRVGWCRRRSALDHAKARAAHLPFEVAHADTGLLELADGPLIARRVIPSGCGERAQRGAFERDARVGCGASGQIT